MYDYEIGVRLCFDITLQTGVVFDAAPLGNSIGNIMADVKTSSSYRAGDTVIAQFIG